MNWVAFLASLHIATSTPITIPTPPIYQDRNVIVTLRPGVDLDLNYFGLSLMIRARKIP